MVAGIVLAAGPSRRFGGPKQLAPFAGRPLLEHALIAMAGSAVERAKVVLGARSAEILENLHGMEPLPAMTGRRVRRSRPWWSHEAISL